MGHRLSRRPIIDISTMGVYSLAFGDNPTRKLLEVTADDLAPFAADLRHADSARRVKPPFAWDPVARRQLASKLDAVFFHLYGISDSDKVRYMFSTFPNLGPSDTEDGNVQPELNACLAWINALAQGEPDADIAT